MRPAGALVTCLALARLYATFALIVSTSTLSVANKQSTYSQSYVLCHEPNHEKCLSWEISRSEINEISSFRKVYQYAELKRYCGVISYKPSLLKKYFKVRPLDGKRPKKIFCGTLTIIGGGDNQGEVPRNGPRKMQRVRRQTARRGRYRGQTQTQYLSIDRNGKDDGKAEAHSDADSSRASVSGSSGMGQAQSQTTYDPSCDECVGRTDYEAANLKHPNQGKTSYYSPTQQTGSSDIAVPHQVGPGSTGTPGSNQGRDILGTRPIDNSGDIFPNGVNRGNAPNTNTGYGTTPLGTPGTGYGPGNIPGGNNMYGAIQPNGPGGSSLPNNNLGTTGPKFTGTNGGFVPNQGSDLINKPGFGGIPGSSSFNMNVPINQPTGSSGGPNNYGSHDNGQAGTYFPNQGNFPFGNPSLLPQTPGTGGQPSLTSDQMRPHQISGSTDIGIGPNFQPQISDGKLMFGPHQVGVPNWPAYASSFRDNNGATYICCVVNPNTPIGPGLQYGTSPGPRPVPGKEEVDTGIPGSQYGPGGIGRPGGNYNTGTRQPGVQYGPGGSGGQQGSDTEAPGGQYGTGMGGPGGQYSSGTGGRPGEQYNPGGSGQYGIGNGQPGGQYGVGTGSPGGQYGSGMGGPGVHHAVGGPSGQYDTGTGGPGSHYATGGPSGQFGSGSGGSGVPYGTGNRGPSGQYGTGSGGPSGEYGTGSGGPSGHYSPGTGGASGQYGTGSGGPSGQHGIGSGGMGGQYGGGPGGQYGTGPVGSGGQFGGTGGPKDQYGAGTGGPGGNYGSGTGRPGGQYGPGTGTLGGQLGSDIGGPNGQYDGGTGGPGSHYGTGGSGGQYNRGVPDGQHATGTGGPSGQYGNSGPDGQYSSGPGASGGQYGTSIGGPGGQYNAGVPGGQYNNGPVAGSLGGQYGTGTGGPGSQYNVGTGGPGGQYVNGPGIPGTQYGTGSGGPGGQYGSNVGGPGSQYGTGSGVPGSQNGAGTGVPGGQYGMGTGSPGIQYGTGTGLGGQYGMGTGGLGQLYGTGTGGPGGQYGTGSGSPGGQIGGVNVAPGGQYGGSVGPRGQIGGVSKAPGGQYGGSVGPGGHFGTGAGSGLGGLGSGPVGYAPGVGGQSIPSGNKLSGTQMGNGGQYSMTNVGSQIGPSTGGPGTYNSNLGGLGSAIDGSPQNVVDPNSIAATLDDYDSNAEATVAQNANGTTASATSRGGNDKGHAQTSVQGTYTGSGSFSAQAEISDENKAAHSEVEGGKKGAKSNSQGRGRNNLSQASVQLGSETGSLQTIAESKGAMHSSNSQVQGSVKGGMADAQARGPGGTSSQAQIGFTPYKEGDKSHETIKTPFVGKGSASAQSSGRSGQSQSSLGGTFKYGISYSGAAQAGASLDKDATFSTRLPFTSIDVFSEKDKNINVNTETPPEETSTSNNDIEEKNDEETMKNSETRYSTHKHSDHHISDGQIPNGSSPVGTTRSFQSKQPNYSNNGVDYEYTTGKDENAADDYYPDGGFDADGTDAGDGEPNEYANYDEYNKESETHQSLQGPLRKGIDVSQTTGGNTQHIVLGSLSGQDAKITQLNSERPDENRIYQPGERVPGIGGYTIPIGFTGSVKSVASKEKTYVVGTKDSPSQAQSVSLSPGTGKVKYVYPPPYGRPVNSKDLKSLQNNNKKSEDSDRYMSVSKSVTRDLDSENNIRKQYSHTYYTKSSSCGYFTFTCTMVSGVDGRKKVCRPKIPTNPDGTPMRC